MPIFENDILASRGAEELDRRENAIASKARGVRVHGLLSFLGEGMKLNSGWMKIGMVAGGGIALVGGLYLVLLLAEPFGAGPEVLTEQLTQRIYRPLKGLFTGLILTAGMWVVLGFTLMMECLIPADPKQKLFSVSFAQDMVWLFYESIFHAFIIAAYVAVLTRVYEQHFSMFTVTAINELPGWARFVFSVLVLDLMYWTQHYVNHKVPFLWRIHAVHHSQKELNFFTDFRYHVLEYIVRHTFLVIPFLIFRVDAPQIVAFAVFQRWHSRFYHGNIRTNLGPLRYIFVTPQSHRVHHSIEVRHHDRNFGAIFSFWDFLFRTQYKAYDEYPETGIGDDEFPHETSTDLWSLLTTPLKQMLHPFRSRKARAEAAIVPEATVENPGFPPHQPNPIHVPFHDPS